MNMRLIFKAMAVAMSTFIISCGAPNSKKQDSVAINQDKDLVTADDFNRAETDFMYQTIIDAAGGKSNVFFHFRELTQLDKQTVVRMNRDVLYTGSVWDNKEGLTITYPETDGRYATIQVMDNDHYTVEIYDKPGTYELAPSKTRFVYLIIRIQVIDANDPKDIAYINDIQDQFKAVSKSNEDFPKHNWDLESLAEMRAKFVRDALEYDGFDNMQGKRGEVDEEIRHIATAAGWGLLPDEEATYFMFGDDDIKSGVAYKATFDVPDNTGFWSITVYNNSGFMDSNHNIVNSGIANFNDDGTFTVCFGSESQCGNAKNRVDAPKDGWNYLMRVYKPGKSVLNDEYKLPELEEIK